MTATAHFRVAGQQAKKHTPNVRGVNSKDIILQIQHGYRLREASVFDGTIVVIDTIAVASEVADNMYQRSKLDYLI